MLATFEGVLESPSGPILNRYLISPQPVKGKEGIQPSIVEQIQAVITSCGGRLSVLLVEQFLDFALAVADSCYVMDQGRIVLKGIPGSLDERLLKNYLSV